VAFITESGFDRLNVNGVDYSGSNRPEGIPVSAGAVITWVSDVSTVDTGFEICTTSGACGTLLHLFTVIRSSSLSSTPTEPVSGFVLVASLYLAWSLQKMYTESI